MERITKYKVRVTLRKIKIERCGKNKKCNFQMIGHTLKHERYVGNILKDELGKKKDG